MYEQIKSDIVQEYYKTNFPNDGQRFIAWYLRNIHNLDIVEAKSCITDGAGDKQIDAIYIDEGLSKHSFLSLVIYLLSPRISYKNPQTKN